MNCLIFISYRKKDSKNAATWIYEKLCDEFGANVLFFDTGSIEAGDDWSIEILSKLEEAAVVLIIIDNQWLTAGTDDSGVRRIDTEGDWVCKEVETAIKNNKSVLPILIDDAEMPLVSELPASIQKLNSLQPFKIQVNAGPTSGIQELIKSLHTALKDRNAPDKLLEELNKIIEKKYEIIGEIGSGPKLKVYLAKDKFLDRYVAMKVVQNPSYNEEFIAILKDAAKIVAIIPNCIQIFGAWVNKNPVYAVMGYLEGGTLRHAIDETELKGLPSSEVYNLLLKLVLAMVKAHVAGITHGNIKPSNVILSGNKEPYLSPTSKYQKSNETYILKKFSERTPDPNTFSYREDLCYLAPEIFDRNYAQEDKNEKIDQYMLGLLGYDMLTGRIPHTITTFDELQRLRVNAFKNPELITSFKTDCPGKFAEIIHKMMSIDPNDRFKNLKEVVREMEKVNFDSIEIAKDSYGRCMINKNPNKGFIKSFYNEFIRISPQAANIFKAKGIGENETHKQYDMLRDAIFMLFMFAENKMGEREPNVLTRIAETHNNKNLNISGKLYKHFLKALTNTVCGSFPDGPEAFDEQCNGSEYEKRRIKTAWEEALQPGINYMIGKYWDGD